MQSFFFKRLFSKWFFIRTWSINMPYAQKIYVYLIAFLFKKTGILILSYHRQPGVISPCFAFPPGTSTLESAGVVVEFPTWISFRVFFSKKPTSRRGTPWFFNTRNNCQSQMEFSKDHGETNPNKWKKQKENGYNTIGFDQKATNRGDPDVVGTDRCDIHLSFCSRAVLSVSLFHKR